MQVHLGEQCLERLWLSKLESHDVITDGSM